MSLPADQSDLDGVRDLLASGEFGAAAALYATADPDPGETRAFFSSLDVSDAAKLLTAMTDERKAREVLLWLPPRLAQSVFGALSLETGSRLASGLRSDERADLLSGLDEELREKIQSLLSIETRADTARLLEYPPDTAGGLMETELLSYKATGTVGDAIRDLRANQQKYAEVAVQYVYLVDANSRLIGVAPIRDLMLAREDATLASLIKRPPSSVRDTATTRDLALAFDENPFLALPVVNDAGLLLGVVNRADAVESEQAEAEDDYRVSQGIVGGEELRSMPVFLRLRRRTAWLGVNLVLCLGGAAVISMHQDTLAKAIVVASVLPIVSATSGNAAMQAAAVSIRELTLGIIDSKAWRRVLTQEMMLALLVGLPLGVAVALLSRMWGAKWTVGAAVGAAMALNTLVAIAIGALCPLLLRRLRIDPALASGPISTTLADVSGFALTLTFVAMAAS